MQELHQISHQSSEPFANEEGVLWEGLEVPMSTIRERYQIDWQNPIGIGAYGKVHEVRILRCQSLIILRQWIGGRWRYAECMLEG